MENGKASATAIMTAYCRGYHAMKDNPKIFDDFLAYRLLTEAERTSLEQNVVKMLPVLNPELASKSPDQAAALEWVIKSFMPSALFISRARYTEDSLERAVRGGVQQYVILGAGLDTFAFRHPDIVRQLRVFEIDHPATQADKRRRLDESGLEIPAQLHFLPVNFTQESLASALQRAPYDLQAPTFFSWLGVVHYLPRDAVFDTLRTIAEISPAGSTVIFDYYDTDAFIPERAAKHVQMGIQIASRLGEPQITGFDPSTLAADLQGVGLRLQEQLSPADIQERYFKGRTDGYHAYEHAHFACAVVE